MKILVYGPMDGKLTGQSAITKHVSNLLNLSGFDTEQLNNNFEGYTSNFQKIYLSLFILLKFIKLIGRVDVVYCSLKRGTFSSLVDLLALLCAKAFKKYSIVHIHGNEIVTILEGKRGIRYHLLKYTLDISSQIIVLNTFQMAELANIIESDKIFIVSNFSEDKISKSELVGKLAIIPKKKLQILFLSNLMIEKGFFKFLEISNRLGSTFEFVLCGTPIAKDLNNVEKIRKNIYKNYKNIKFLGPVYGEKKNSILKSSDIFFFPSVYATEAQPLVLIEAISFGCGPLVAERPYISDILNKNGLLTVSSDPSTEEIFDLLQNVNQQREKLLNYISGNYENSKNFSVTIFDKKVIQIFQRIESIGT